MGEMTPQCSENCSASCGVCGTKNKIVNNSVITRTLTPNPKSISSDPDVYRLLFSFSKKGSAVFHGHLDLVEIFSMAMCRAGLNVMYTQGFNPLVKIEIVAPLSLGISAGGEMAAVEFAEKCSPEEFTIKLNNALPSGIVVNKAESYLIPSGGKKYSLSSLLWGFGYRDNNGNMVYTEAKEEKACRNSLLADGSSSYFLKRESVLAKNIVCTGVDKPWTSFFEAYNFLYKKS